ncbi:hypothetical protein PHLCEN_2v6888 [Hermanssonia centrifuga]|uniref:Uncharacterized protein n=1 Tax=Hermanssonia centrifuga TaxID=98765 RepID=A0A2R6NY51_9APHY|nr:hypothetical protein PHLCEN_2v6888 [Hermanssonia centrifuga]
MAPTEKNRLHYPEYNSQRVKASCDEAHLHRHALRRDITGYEPAHHDTSSSEATISEWHLKRLPKRPTIPRPKGVLSAARIEDAADHKSKDNDDSHQSPYGLEYSFEVSQCPQEPV